ncbi:hypothetical protein BH11ARM2_BH11ARM2_02620 [soil metagenome]
MNQSQEQAEAVYELVTEVHVSPESKTAFQAWEEKWGGELGRFDGFVSRETIPPSLSDEDTWFFVTRFASPKALRDWRASETHKRLSSEIRQILPEDSYAEIGWSAAAAFKPEQSFTEVILDRVRPGKEDAYREWSRRIQEAQAKSGGYQGGYTEPTSSGDAGWMTLMRFATVADLQRWMNSPERAALVAQGKDLIADSYTHQVDTAFPGWVPTDPATGDSPANWKATMLVLLGLYPIVALEIAYLTKVMTGIPGPVSGFISNALSCIATGYITMPLLVRWMGWWLFPPKESAQSANIKGTAILALVYIVEIILCWNLLK